GVRREIFRGIGGEFLAAAVRAEIISAGEMSMAMAGLMRVDPHAAYGIDGIGAARGRLGAVRAMGGRGRMSLAGLHRHALALETTTPQGYIRRMRNDSKTSALKRLQRIEGQVRGLSRMVEEDRYCIDIVTQIAAVRAALRRAEEEILRDHVASCVDAAFRSGN